MNFLFIPDSFKGTLSSAQICHILQRTAKKVFPNCECSLIPVADGGEGTVDCFLEAVGGERVTLQTADPFFAKMQSYYGLIHEGSTAVIEMASCAGLPLVEGREDPKKTTTFGVGELIADALTRNVKNIIIGLGGSATNDGGCGAAAALGVRFVNENGQEFVPTGGTLKDIYHIDISKVAARLYDTNIIAMCDIDNPMYGENGAAYIFGPQKGADSKTVKELDEGLVHLARIIKQDLGLEVSSVPGTGAAGAMGAGCLAFFKARLQSGISTVLDTVGFDKLANKADFIFTGEGKLDSQSLQGKVVIGIAKRAKALNKPVIAIVGGVDDKGLSAAYDLGISAIFSINRLPQDFAVARELSEQNLEASAENIFRLIKISTT